MENKEFWYVFNPIGESPKHKHFTSQGAEEEAKRLVLRDPSSHYEVLRCESIHKAEIAHKVERLGTSTPSATEVSSAPPVQFNIMPASTTPPLPEMRDCALPHCSMPFIPKSYNHKFCRPDCEAEAKKDRREKARNQERLKQIKESVAKNSRNVHLAREVI